MNKNGTSLRANKQVSEANSKTGWNRFVARVISSAMRNKMKALNWEYGKVKAYEMSNKKPLSNSPRFNKKT